MTKWLVLTTRPKVRIASSSRCGIYAYMIEKDRNTSKTRNLISLSKWTSRRLLISSAIACPMVERSNSIQLVSLQRLSWSSRTENLGTRACLQQEQTGESLEYLSSLTQTLITSILFRVLASNFSATAVLQQIALPCIPSTVKNPLTSSRIHGATTSHIRRTFVLCTLFSESFLRRILTISEL